MKRNMTITVVTIVLALVVANFVASRHFLRADLTRNKEYTLAKSTQKTLRELNDVVTLRMYFTKDMPPQLLALTRVVDDTIDEFRSYAGKNLTVEYVDPADDSESQREAIAAGVMPVQLNVQDNNKIEVAKVFLGIGVMKGEKRETIPVVVNPQTLEYDLVSRILKLTSAKLPTVAWWGPEMAADANSIPGLGYVILRKELNDRYTVTDVNPQLPELDPEKTSVLMLVSPKGITVDQRFAIDQYLMRGGQVIALVDTADVSPQLQAASRTSGIEAMLAHYGISVTNDLLMDRANAPAMFMGGVVNYQIPYPFWVKVLPQDTDPESRMIAGLDSLVLPWTSSLTLAETPPEGVTLKSLARTTDFAKAQGFSDGYKLDPETAGNAMQSDGGKSYTVIASAEGKLPSYFKSGKEEAPKGRTVMDAAAPARMVVVGTSRVAQDQFVHQFPQDKTLLLNAVDVMSWGDQLVDVRTRSQLGHPIAEMSNWAEAIIKYANIAGGVILVGVIAVAVVTHRRARRKLLQTVYQ